MGNAGRVLMIPKGDYNAATTYEMLDFVYYQGRSYVCKQTSTGNVPTNTTYWQALTGDASAEIQALTNYVTETGVKNFGALKAGTKTDKGVTWTIDANGVIDIDGAASGWTSYGEIGSEKILFSLKAGDYIVTTGNNIPTQTWVTVKKSDGTAIANVNPNTAQYTFTLSEDAEVYMYVGTSNSATMSHVKLYPMIRDASITDPTYQPYAKTNVELTQDASWLTSAKTYYDANTDPTVKQNHYNVAKYFYDFIKAGESHTVIVRYAGGYFDTMIISRDSGNGLYCVDFCHADGLGKILYFRYNGSNDTFTDLFSVT